MSDPQRKPGGHYSGSNPIPSIHKFMTDISKGEKEDVNSFTSIRGPADGMKRNQSKTETSRSIVTDPITGREVEIENADDGPHESISNPKITVPNTNIVQDATSMTHTCQKEEEFKNGQGLAAPSSHVEPCSISDVPVKDEKTNILFHPTPSISYEPMYVALEKKVKLLCIGILIAIVVPGRLIAGSIFGLIPLGLCISSGIFLWMKFLLRKGRSNEWQSEKKRGQNATASLVPESAEWLNSLLEVFWGLIDPEKFSAVADTLEDVMQASVPSMIENVRVAEINQGDNPIRILSLRALPSERGMNTKNSPSRQNLDGDFQKPIEDGDRGDFYNLECSLAYHSTISSNLISEQTKRMYMKLVFYLGVKGLFGVPLPIFVELERLVGTARLRLQISPEPPFFNTLTFTLMGLPKIQACCSPMIHTGINFFDLPLISNFVNYAISAAANEYVAPKSMTIDMRKILRGDDIQKDVEALGILWVRIHYALRLSKQDFSGSEDGGSDPYITVSFSKYGKPMYCTRVIQDDLNPNWEEACAILITPDLLKVDERLSIELWDSDRSTSDDMVGKVELSLQKLTSHPGKMYPQISKLRGSKNKDLMPGELHWEVGYFGKSQFRQALKTEGKDINLPDRLIDMKVLQDDKGTLDTANEVAVMHTPPDPLWPSGICSVIVHQIVDLSLRNLGGGDGKRKGCEYEPAQELFDAKKEEDKGLPSSYCAILFNDQLAYRTRTKVTNSKPIFNAGTERFMRDWRSGIVAITVRDQRMREHDPILGVVSLKLSNLLQTSSQVTRWYPLSGGIGYGRIRISVLFRSVETCLPPEQLGWDVGTFVFTSDKIVSSKFKLNSKIKIRTGGSSAKISRVYCQEAGNYDGMSWEISNNKKRHGLRLPVKYRYRCPLVLEFHTSKIHSADAYSIIWLHHLEDNKDYDFDIPVWQTNNSMRLIQNYVTEENSENIPGLQIEELGRLKFKGFFKPGIDHDHRRFITDNDSRETQEMWEACQSKGLRETDIAKEVPPITRQLHELSILNDEAEKQMSINNHRTFHDRISEDESEYLGKDLNTSDKNRVKSYPDQFEFSPAETSPALGENLDSTSSDESDLGQDDFKFSQDDIEQLRQNLKSKNPFKQARFYKEKKETLHRQQGGLMQWKPMRNLAFAKDETKYLLRQTLRKASLQGRQPGVETET